MLVALNACLPEVLTAAELDFEIDILHAAMNRTPEWAPNNYLRSWCGQEGQSWHISCIKQALRRKYGHHGIMWKKLSKDCIYDKNIGKLYVHGTLNSACFPTLDPSGDWSHAICIDTDPKVSQLLDVNNFEEYGDNTWFDLSYYFQKGNETENLFSRIAKVFSIAIKEK
jgi:hypothetical protein